MVLELVVLLFLGGVAVAAILLGRAALRGLSTRAAESDRGLVRERTAAARREVSGPVWSDGLVYLFAHEFVRPAPRGRAPTPEHRRAYAPLTGEEVDPQDWAEQIVYAGCVELIRSGHLVLEVRESEPTFMPPYPHKRWTLYARRTRPLPSAPLPDALGCGFDLAVQRESRAERKKGRSAKEEGFPLDVLLEDALKVMRQEMSFWQKGGVYADVRRYIEAQLIESGYLYIPPRETWLERLRHSRPQPNTPAVQPLAPRAAVVARRVSEFRREHGSPAAAGDSPGGGAADEVDQALVGDEVVVGHLPLHDCLRISIHEALAAIRQLEPSEDIGA